MKFISLAIIIYFVACKNNKQESIQYEIKISDEKLVSIIKNFKIKYIALNENQIGVIHIKPIYACKSITYELTRIVHINSFEFSNQIYYSIIDDLPVFFTHEGSYSNSIKFLSQYQIRKICSKNLMPDESLPPTEFAPTILFNDKKGYIFSVIDTLFKYDNAKLLNVKINNYLGNLVCY